MRLQIGDKNNVFLGFLACLTRASIHRHMGAKLTQEGILKLKLGFLDQIVQLIKTLAHSSKHVMPTFLRFSPKIARWILIKI